MRPTPEPMPMPDTAATILVVEDDAFTTALLRFLLERQGLQVQTVADGPSALARLAQGPVPDAVVLDLLLPQVSGLAVLARLREQPAWAQTPVLVLSALDAGSDMAQAFAAGAHDYLSKPFNPEELLARLQRLLPQAWPTHARGTAQA